MNELVRRCLALSYGARKRMIKVLTKSLQNTVDGEVRFNELFKIVTDMVGDGLLTNSRNADFVLGRNVIAYQMRQERYSLSTIGYFLNRDHSTICCICKKMQDVMEYPSIYKREIEFWNEFQRRLNESKTI